MTTYKKINSLDTDKMIGVLKDDRHSIPLEPANTDYQAYLKWLEEGGVVLPADEPNN